MKTKALRLAEVCSMRTGKLDSNAANPDGEYPFFTCAQETFRINEYAFDTEAVLLGGNNANGIFPLKYYSGKFNAYQRTYILESLNKSLLLTRYLFYALRPALAHFRSASIGAATQYLTKSILDNFRVRIPPVDAQQKIVECLRAYDDLIENNRRRIHLLDQSVRMLFEEWFARLRFPGHEHLKITDGVPEGWKKSSIGNCVAFLGRGITPTYEDGAECIVINQKCIRDGLLNVELARHQSKEVPRGKFIQRGDVLINSTGEGTLGRIASVISKIENCTVDSHITIVRPMSEIGFSYFALSLLSAEGYLSLMGRGATNQTELSRETIAGLPMLIPPQVIRDTFEEIVSPLFMQTANLLKQNVKLSDARDLLLQPLMNGEIPI